MKNLKQCVTKLSTKERGATMIEYAIMVALIAIVAISAVTLLGQNVSQTFGNIATSLPVG